MSVPLVLFPVYHVSMVEHAQILSAPTDANVGKDGQDRTVK